MSEGTVKWFNPRKGYGFITAGDGKDIFVHYADITGEGYRTLVEGDVVTFDIVEGEKGLRAESVVHQPPPESAPESAPEGEPESKPEGEPESAPESAPEGEPESKPEGEPESKEDA